MQQIKALFLYLQCRLGRNVLIGDYITLAIQQAYLNKYH